MHKLLFVGPDRDTFSELESSFRHSDQTLHDRSESGNAALEKIGNHPCDLVVASEQLVDMTGIEFARQVIARNPLINIVLVSSLSDAEFHEATEGLGILAKLPPDPHATQADSLLRKLDTILRP